MKLRVPRFLALASLVLAPLAALSATSPNATAAPSDFCGVSGPPPCIVSAFRGAVPLDQSEIIVDTYGDPTEALHNTGFTILGLDSGDVGTTYTVTMRTHFKPRVISMTGGYVSTERYLDSDVWYAVVQLTPVEILESCDNPVEPYCPETASPEDVQIQAQGNINDADWYPENPDALHGLDQFSNINLLWYPPTIAVSSTGATQLIFEMENSHYYPDGTTVFQGSANVRIPNNVLRDFYGIPNPETMVPGSLIGTIGTGSVEAYEVESANAWQIDASGITFSKRRLKTTRGVIVPRKPQGLFGARTGATTAKLTFAPAGERGAKVTGYQAKCVSPGGHVVTKLRTDPIESVTVGGLRVGVKYTCKVRAKSKVGYGPFSTGVTVPRKP